MKFWKLAALVALATIPLILIAKKKQPVPLYGDPDSIFDNELNTD